MDANARDENDFDAHHSPHAKEPTNTRMETHRPHKNLTSSAADKFVVQPLCYVPLVPPCEASSDSLELNNLAVTLLQSKKFVDAIAVLHQAWDRQGFCHPLQPPLALATAAAMLLQLPRPTVDLGFLVRPTIEYDYTYRQPCISSAPCDGSSSAVGVKADFDLTSSPSNSFSVYNRAFLFKEEDVDSMSWLRRARLLPAVILYNLGLVHLRQALGQVQSAEYTRAIEMFSISLSIVEESLTCALYSSDYSLLQLALYNNMGFINSHFFNENASMVCAGRMLATFASMDCSRLLSKEEYVFYYMNLLFLLNRHPIFAPAA